MKIFNLIINFLCNIFLFNRKKDRFQNWYNAPRTETFTEKITYTPPKSTNKTPKWSYPVKNRKETSKFGWRIILGKRRWHNGTDFTGKNKNCIAPTDCIITKILKPDYEYPVKFKYKNKKFIRITNIPLGRAWTPYVIANCLHDNTIRFLFKHVDTLLKIGDELKYKEIIAEIGNWGYSMGSHLHFEIQVLKLGKWKNVDPIKFLNKKIEKSKIIYA